MIKPTLLFLFFVCCWQISFGQNAEIDSLERLLVLAKQDTSRVLILNKLAYRYRRSDGKRSLELSNEALQLSQELNYRKGQSAALYMRGYAYYPMGEYEKAIKALKKSLIIALEDGDTSRMAYCHGIMAMVQGRMSDYQKALKNNLKARTFFVALKDTLTLAAINTNIGTIYEEKGVFDTALVYYFESLKYKRAVGAHWASVTELANIGAAYTVLKEYELSLNYNWEAIQTIQLDPANGMASHLFCNRGHTYLQIEHLDSALYYGQRAYQIDREKQLPYFQVNSCKLMGGIYEKMGQPGKAAPFFEEGIAIAQEIGNSDFQASIGCRLGEIYLQLGKPYDAKRVAKNAFDIAKSLEILPHLECTSTSLSKIYEAIGDFKSALEYQKLSENFRDSLGGLEKSVRLVELEKQYQTEFQANQIAQQELLISKQRTQQRNFIIGALALLLLSFAIAQYILYRHKLKRKETELALKIQKAESEKLRELDHLKSNFFANISHEFRTPLTLILNPLKSIKDLFLEHGPTDEINVPIRYVAMMERNAQRLLNLINQLLDLSKLESGKMRLSIKKGALVRFLRAMVFSFESLAERRNIDFQTHFPENQTGWFDRDKLEKVLSNLLSNAFKFTPEKGKVKVHISIDNQLLTIEISDSGEGIPQEELNNIFERFYQLEGKEDSGSGIGLSLVKELVELHKGQISLRSQLGQGTTFEVQIPIGKSFYETSEIIEDSSQIELSGTAFLNASFQNQGNHTNNLTPIEDSSKTQREILIVEDNQDLQNFIAEILTKDYHILQARDGNEGLILARKHQPDLIISDVMMPKMDGFDLCKQLKINELTSHIPVILLTAKAGQTHKLEGLELGADDYLTKPFDEKELKIRIQNLINQRQKLAQKFGKTIELKPKEIAITSADEQFLNKVMEGIENNLSNEFFGVEDLAALVNMSRSQLHRKLKALTEQGPNQIIRNFRLQRAKDLLEKRSGSVSEIAFQVGYSSLSYFTKSFRNQFGITPTEMVE